MCPSFMRTLTASPFCWSSDAGTIARAGRRGDECFHVPGLPRKLRRTARIGGSMIVCDGADCWQVVLQTDHADLSGDIARAWAQRTERSGSLVTAAERHDDGWSVWEQAPMCDPETSRPLNFLDVG